MEHRSMFILNFIEPKLMNLMTQVVPLFSLAFVQPRILKI
jgi:hypothetical protein